MPIKLPKSLQSPLNSASFSRQRPPFSSLLFYIFFISILVTTPCLARLCYSCSGQCIQGAPCNCQMGSCEADFCFTEKKPSEILGIFRLSKGCMKRPSRTRAGCDFDHFADHVLCICSGPGDFCNDHILMRVNTASWRNVTCRMCPDGRPNCGQTCQGQWCHQKTSTGASGCGFGPPSLPYLYQTHELLRQTPRVCLTMSRGTAGSMPHRFCICTGHFCNEQIDEFTGNHGQQHQWSTTLFASIIRSLGGGSETNPQQQRSIGRQWEMAALARAHQQPLYECVSCDLSSEDAALTSNCRQNRCKGQFCVYAVQRVFNGPSAGGGGGIANQWSHGRAQNGGGGVVQRNGGMGMGIGVMHEKQGCINVTEPALIQFGCTHKWVQNELEEIYCACRSPLCNTDLSTASASSAITSNKMNIHSTQHFLQTISLILINLFSIKCLHISCSIFP